MERRAMNRVLSYNTSCQCSLSVCGLVTASCPPCSDSLCIYGDALSYIIAVCLFRTQSVQVTDSKPLLLPGNFTPLASYPVKFSHHTAPPYPCFLVFFFCRAYFRSSKRRDQSRILKQKSYWTQEQALRALPFLQSPWWRHGSNSQTSSRLLSPVFGVKGQTCKSFFSALDSKVCFHLKGKVYPFSCNRKLVESVISIYATSQKFRHSYS